MVVAMKEISAFFLSCIFPWVSAVVLAPLLHVGHPQGSAPKAVLEDTWSLLKRGHRGGGGQGCEIACPLRLH